MMLDKVRETLEINNIQYDGESDVVYCKFRKAGSQVKISYDTESMSYKVSTNEFLQSVNAAFSYGFAFAAPYIFDGVSWSWLISALSIFSGTIAVTQLLLTQFKLLDLKQQLRQSGIYLN
ncbi:hypothetical protein EJ063_20150 [Vibrio aquaticus]|uniref:Uncharacterized protein n=1 Tax=Vibrio aquaticus TaxID=2496559 RepID=A0A3S0V0U7_9VIBR|nr:hypothetical protein [Vibrio aquaticus]RTZ13413.1 hypothetical protein EJ063_20150 [Vibrio aquaticus]